MPVLLAGAFGQRNPGDEALLAAFVHELRGWPLVATTSDRVQTESEHGIDTVSAQDPRAVARAVGRADGIVFAGGTVFKTLHPRSGRRPLELLRNGLAVSAAARAGGIPLALSSVGAAPLPTRRARALARAIVNRADLLVLRDDESARLLAEAGAPTPFRVGADASWTRVEAPRAPAARGDAVIVALSRYAGGPGLPARLALVLAPLQRAGLRLRLQPWQVFGGLHEADDLALAREVAAQLPAPAEIVPPPATLDDAVDLFAGARLVVALRFHALVAAAAAGVPSIAYAHEAKLAGLGKRLGQPVVQPAGAAALVGSALLAAAEDGFAPSGEAIAREHERSRAGMALLRLLLSGGSAPAGASVSSLELAPAGWSA